MLNIICLVITGTIIISSIIIYLFRFKNQILSHFTIIAGVCFLVEVFAPMVWIYRGQTAYRSLEVMKYTPEASLYFVLGYLCFCFFFFTKSPRYEDCLLRRADVENDYSDINVHLAWGLYAVFFVMYYLYLRLRGRSLLSQLTFGQKGDYMTDILSSTDSNLWFLMVSLNALVCISIILIFYQRKHKWITYCLFIVTLLLTISAGYRHLMIDAILAPIIAKSILSKKKVSIRKLIVIALALYLIVSWVGAMRDVYRTGSGTLNSFEQDSAFDSFMINIEVFFPYFAYTNYIQSIRQFSFGGTYIAAVLQLIPSLLWRGKSAVVTIIKHDAGYKGMLSSMSAEGIADNYWCEGYKNGGVLGVISVFSILGSVVAKLRKLQYSEYSSDVIIYALSSTFMFQVLTRSFQNALQDGLFLFLPIFLLRGMSRLTIRRK